MTSPEQRRANLAIANYVRRKNGELAREIKGMSCKDGCAKVAQVLAEPAGPPAAFPIGRLLLCIHSIGEDGMAQYLRHAGIFSTTRRVGALTERQRDALADALLDRRLLFPYAKAA